MLQLFKLDNIISPWGNVERRYGQVYLGLNCLLCAIFEGFGFSGNTLAGYARELVVFGTTVHQTTLTSLNT